MIRNEHYKAFLDGDFLEKIDIDQLKIAIENIDKNEAINTEYVRYKIEAKALLVLLYYTGARPAEILELKGSNIIKEKSGLQIRIPTLKKGRARIIDIPLSKPLIKDIYDYIGRVYPDFYLFPHYRSNKIRTYKTKKGEVKVYHVVAHKLYYHFKNWFKDVLDSPIPPYYLRHNRFTKLAEKGATLEDIRQIKGAKRMDSVFPYLHMSRSTSKKIGRKLD